MRTNYPLFVSNHMKESRHPVCLSAIESEQVTFSPGATIRVVLRWEQDTHPNPEPPRQLLGTALSCPEPPKLPFFVTNYLEKGPDDNYRATCAIDGNTALHQAMQYLGHTRIRIVRLLLEKGIDVNARDNQGNTPLHLLVDSSSSLREEVIKLLLEHNVIVDSQNRKGQTALHLASKSGHETTVRELLGRNAWIDTQENSGKTALHLATSCGNESMVKLLLEHGANINAQDSKGLTALHIAAKLDNHASMVRMLLSNGADVNIQDFHGRTVFHIVIKNQDKAMIELLLKNAANPDVPDRNGNTARSLDIHFHFETIRFEAGRPKQAWDPHQPKSSVGKPLKGVSLRINSVSCKEF